MNVRLPHDRADPEIRLPALDGDRRIEPALEVGDDACCWSETIARMPVPRDRIIRHSTRMVYENPWMQIREDAVEFPGGRRGIYGVVDKPNFAVVLPYENGGFWLVEQFRYPIGRRTWEFPLGAWPNRRDGDLRELAVNELREETGKLAGSLTLLGTIHSAPGTQSNHFGVYLAEDLTDTAVDREPTEADMICEWRSEHELRGMILRGTFADAQSLSALTLFLLRGQSEKTDVVDRRIGHRL